MAFFKLLISCVAVVTLVSAQANNTQLQIEAIQAHFAGAELVPVPIPAFDPTAILAVSFSGTVATPGQLLTEARMSRSRLPGKLLTTVPQRSKLLLLSP